MPALLHQAILDGRLHQVRLLARIGSDLNAREEKHGRTPIITAALLDNEDTAVAMCQILIKHHCDINSKDNSGKTAISNVATLGREKITLFLLEDININLSTSDNQGNTPLMLAAQRGNAVIVASMLKKMHQFNINVNARNKDGFSAILIAAKHGHRYCEQILRHQGQASIEIRDNVMFYNVDDWLQWHDEQNEINTRSLKPTNIKSTNFVNHYGNALAPSSKRRNTVSRTFGSELPQIDSTNRSLASRSKTLLRTNKSCEDISSSNDTSSQKSLLECEALNKGSSFGSANRRKTLDLNTLLSIYSRSNDIKTSYY